MDNKADLIKAAKMLGEEIPEGMFEIIEDYEEAKAAGIAKIMGTHSGKKSTMPVCKIYETAATFNVHTKILQETGGRTQEIKYELSGKEQDVLKASQQLLAN